MKNGVFWVVTVALVRTDVSENLSASFIRVTRIGELGTTLALTRNRRTLRFLQEPHGVTSQKTQFFIVTAMKTSNLRVYQSSCRQVLIFEASVQSVFVMAFPPVGVKSDGRARSMRITAEHF
jgi:hypothetical protein